MERSPQPPERDPSLTHLDPAGHARMVDVSGKPRSARTAIAGGRLRCSRDTFEAIRTGNTPKGDVFATARLAGIMAAKQTANLIPLCHPIPLHKVDVKLELAPDLPGIEIRATCTTNAETGVEMEAQTAATVAALTLYDMAKALEKSLQIEGIRLLHKTGGRSGEYTADDWEAGC